MMSEAVVCRAVSRAYPVSTELVWALQEVDAAADRGALTVFAGPSGSGKSTLLRLVAAIDLPDRGTVTIGEQEVSSMSPQERRRFRRRHIGYVFGEPAANLIAYMTSIEHLQMAARIRGPVTDDLVGILDQMGLAEVKALLPQQLSSGQQQRLGLAMGVVGRPALLIADEPTAELDSESAGQVVEVLRHLRQSGTTLIVASHDPDLLAIADDVIRLDHGRRVG